MQTAKIVFAASNKPFAILIKLFTLSHWSHCGIIDGSFVIDTTLSTGVRRIPFGEWKQHYDHYVIVEMPIEDKSMRLHWARSQVGKKYDPLGILSLALRKNFSDRDSYFCSELVAIYLGITERTWRLSPQWLWSLYKTTKSYLKGLTK